MEFSNPIQFWLLIASVAGVSFMLGRSTSSKQKQGDRSGISPNRNSQQRHESADLDFSTLSMSNQAEVDRLLREGKLINAIKIVREETGLGLKEAKEIAEHRQRSVHGG